MCCYVCTEWKELIYTSSWLNLKRNRLDPHNPLKCENLVFKESIKCEEASICQGFSKDEIFVMGMSTTKLLSMELKSLDIKHYCVRSKYKYRAIGMNGPNLFLGHQHGIDIINRQDLSSLNYCHTSFVSTQDLAVRGICFPRNGNILVTTTERLFIFKSDGESIRMVGDFVYNDIHLDGIAVNSKDEIYIINRYACAVYILNSDGRLLNAIDYGPMDEYGCLGRIYIDYWDNIYIYGPASNNILIFDSNRLPIQKITTSFPVRDLCIIGKRMIVSSTKGDLYVYQE